MTIKQLIEQLKKHPNLNAKIEIIANIGNAEDDKQDIIFNNIEVWNIDNFSKDYITLFTQLNN
jgi:hypothetical protein